MYNGLIASMKIPCEKAVSKLVQNSKLTNYNNSSPEARRFIATGMCFQPIGLELVLHWRLGFFSWKLGQRRGPHIVSLSVNYQQDREIFFIGIVICSSPDRFSFSTISCYTFWVFTNWKRVVHDFKHFFLLLAKSLNDIYGIYVKFCSLRKCACVFNSIHRLLVSVHGAVFISIFLSYILFSF